MPKLILNCWVSINIKTVFMDCDSGGCNKARPLEDF